MDVSVLWRVAKECHPYIQQVIAVFKRAHYFMRGHKGQNKSCRSSLHNNNVKFIPIHTYSYLFFLDISVQGGKVHEVILMKLSRLTA